MGSHFYDWVDYKGVTFSIEFLEWGCILDFWGKTKNVCTVDVKESIIHSI